MPTFQILDRAEPRIDQLGQNLAQYNDASVGPSDRKVLAVIVEEDEAQLIAGLSGYTAWGWLFTQWIWVAPLHRSQGLASALLTRAEAEAQSRGCIGAHIDTFSERALNLYQRQGYEIFGQIPDFVGGQTRSFLSKRWA